MVEVPLIFIVQKSRNLSLTLTPFFEFWQDGSTTGKSPSGIFLGLPKNTYVLWVGELKLEGLILVSYNRVSRGLGYFYDLKGAFKSLNDYVLMLDGNILIKARGNAGLF